MFKFVEVGTSRFDFELNGGIDAEMMAHIITAFETKLTDREGIHLMYKISDFEMPTAAAVMMKLGELPRLLKLIKNIDKIAIVVDQRWLRKVAEFEGALIPGLKIRGFSVDQIVEAEDWLSETISC